MKKIEEVVDGFEETGNEANDEMFDKVGPKSSNGKSPYLCLLHALCPAIMISQ